MCTRASLKPEPPCLPTPQQSTKELTKDDKDEKQSGDTCCYVEHDADVVGKLVLVFDIGYQNGRDQEPNGNSKLWKTETVDYSYQWPRGNGTNF